MKKLITLLTIVSFGITTWGQNEDLLITKSYIPPNTGVNYIKHWIKIAECNITYACQDVGATIDFLGNGSSNGTFYYRRVVARFKNQNNGHSHALTLFGNQTFNSELPSSETLIDCQEDTTNNTTIQGFDENLNILKLENKAWECNQEMSIESGVNKFTPTTKLFIGANDNV